MSLEAGTPAPNPSRKSELLQLGIEIESSFLNKKTAADTKNLLLACKDPNLFEDPTTIIPKKRKKWIAPRSPEKSNSEPNFIKIGNNSLADAISNSDSEKVLSSETKSNLWRKLIPYLKSIDKNNQATYSPDDEIIVRKDEAGPYLIFLRGKKSSPKIRP